MNFYWPTRDAGNFLLPTHPMRQFWPRPFTRSIPPSLPPICWCRNVFVQQNKPWNLASYDYTLVMMFDPDAADIADVLRQNSIRFDTIISKNLKQNHLHAALPPRPNQAKAT